MSFHRFYTEVIGSGKITVRILWHFALLMYKEFLCLRREYFWTLFELILPIVISIWFNYTLYNTDQSVPGRKIILTPLNNTSKFRLVPYKFRTKKFPRITITGTAEDFFRHTVDLIPIEADGCQQNRRILVACGSYADLIQVEKLVEMLNERYSIKYCDLEKFFKFVSKNVGKVDTTVNSLNLTNGIKFLQAKGFICPDDLESLISRYVNNVTDKDLIDLYLPLTIESKQLYKFELVRSSKLLHRYLEYDTNYRDECRRRFAGGIYISSYDTFQPSLKYRIYLPNANLAWNTGITYSGTDLPDIPIPGSPNQWSSGLLTLQYAVEDSFIKDVFIRNSYPITNKSPSFIPNFILKLQRFPKLHTGDRELAEAVSAFRLFWPWFVILPVIHCVSVITSERESGMLTYLETVGIYRSMYYTVNGVTMFLKLILAQMIGIVFWFHRFRVVPLALFISVSATYIICVISYSHMMSALVKNCFKVKKITFIVWIISVTATFLTEPYGLSIPKFFFYFNFNEAFTSIMKIMEGAIQNEARLDWWNRNTYLGFTQSIGFAFGMLFIDALLMLSVRAYIDNVFLLPHYLEQFFSLFFNNSEKKDSNFNLEYYHYTKPATNMEIYDNLLDPAEIEVDFLIKNYGHVQAVYIRSFKAYVGQITVLLGPNQAGKSTILSMLNGTIRPTAGTIKICGEFLDIRTTAACQDYISYCPPNNPHFRSMTVCEHIKFFKYLKPRSDTSIHELMEQFGIIDMANKSVDSLSNEARRKLCLAIAFANCCKIVLVDEPTAGMENADKEMVYKLLNEFKHEKCILVATPFIDEATAVADRLMVIGAGRILCSGTLRFLKNQFETEFILEISLRPLLDARVVERRISNFIMNFLGRPKLLTVTKRKISYSLPANQRKGFVDMFGALERKFLDDCIETYHVEPMTIGGVPDIIEANEQALENLRKKAKKLQENTVDGEFLWKRRLKYLIGKQVVCYARSRLLVFNGLLLPTIILLTFLTSFDISSLNGHYKIRKVQQNEIMFNVENYTSFILSNPRSNITSHLITNLQQVLGGSVNLMVDTWNTNTNETTEYTITDDTRKDIGFIPFFHETATCIGILGLYNVNFLRGPAVVVNRINNARLGRKDAIVAGLQPYGTGPLPAKVTLEDGDVNLTYLSVIFYSIYSTASALVFSSFVLQMIHERNCNFKLQILLTGVSPTLYWISIFIGNFVVYCGISMVLFIILLSSDWIIVTGYSIILLWLLQFWSFMPLVCLISCLFNSKLWAYLFMLVYLAYIPHFFSVMITTFVDELYGTYAILSSILHPPIIIAFYFSHGLKATLPWTYTLLASTGCLYYFLILLIQNSCCFVGYISRMRMMLQETFAGGEESSYTIFNEQQKVYVSSPYFLAIRIENLTKLWKGSFVLKNLYLGVEKNECVGLLGKSSLDKTVLCDILTGSTSVDSGSATINGSSVTRRRAFGYCPKTNCFLESLTVREMLTLMVTLRGYTDINERVQNVLQMILLDEVCGELVGSLRQIGLAIITQTRVILLDRPTEATDPKTRQQIWGILKAIINQNYTVLLLSSNIDECKQLCGRIGLLRDGELVVIDTPQRVLDKTVESYELTFILDDEEAKEAFAVDLKGYFPTAVTVFSYAAHMVWRIPKSRTTSWSTLYANAEELLMTQPAAKDYSIHEVYAKECQ